jgi:hypothetical protein
MSTANNSPQTGVFMGLYCVILWEWKASSPTHDMHTLKTSVVQLVERCSHLEIRDKWALVLAGTYRTINIYDFVSHVNLGYTTLVWLGMTLSRCLKRPPCFAEKPYRDSGQQQRLAHMQSCYGSANKTILFID